MSLEDAVVQKIHAQPFSLNCHDIILALPHHTPSVQAQKNSVLNSCFMLILFLESVKIKLSGHHSCKLSEASGSVIDLLNYGLHVQRSADTTDALY